jgi:hypothetical protein
LRKIGPWLDDHSVSTPEAVEEIIEEHQEEIVEALTEHKGELSELGQQIFDAVNELKERIDNAQLTNEDKEFLREIKKNFDPDEFEKRLERGLKKLIDKSVRVGEFPRYKGCCSPLYFLSHSPILRSISSWASIRPSSISFSPCSIFSRT